MSARGRRTGRAGFTLLEALIGATLLVFIMGAALALSLSGQRATLTTGQRSRARAEAERALTRIAAELETTSRNALTPDPGTATGTDSLTYVQPIGVVGANVTWSEPIQIAFEYSPTDPDGGGDNDGNGIVDDGRVVLTRGFGGASPRRTVLCNGVPELFPGETANLADDNGNGVVDERGFNVQRNGELLTVRLAVIEPGAGDRIVTATVETTISLRN